MKKRWFKLRSDFTRHDKVLMAGGKDAGWFFLCASTWAEDQLTDGFIPDYALSELGQGSKGKGLAKRLADAGLFIRVEEESGYQIANYLEYHQSAKEVREDASDLSSKRSAAGALGGKQKASNLLAKSLAKPVANELSTGLAKPENEQQNGSKEVAREVDRELTRASPAGAHAVIHGPEIAPLPRPVLPWPQRFEQIFAEVLKRPAGGTGYTLTAARLVAEWAPRQEPPVEPEAFARALLPAFADMLADWCRRGEHHGEPSTAELSDAKTFAKALGWLEGKRPGTRTPDRAYRTFDAPARPLPMAVEELPAQPVKAPPPPEVAEKLRRLRAMQ